MEEKHLATVLNKYVALGLDDTYAIPDGTISVVRNVDDIGTIHVG